MVASHDQVSARSGITVSRLSCVRAGSNILNPLRYAIANNELEAKFSPAFMVAAVAIRRKAGIHEFTDEFEQWWTGLDDEQQAALTDRIDLLGRARP